MDFQLDEAQTALRDGMRAFCEGRFPDDALREVVASRPMDRALWRELAEMGVFALRLPEAEGGIGLGVADAVLVFAELGRRVVPGPTLWTHLAAPLVKGAATGDVVVGGLAADVDETGPLLVEHAGSLDVLLVVRPEGVWRVDRAALELEPVATPLDPLTPVARLRVLPRGEPVGDAVLAARLRREGAALAAAQLLGIAEATLERAVDYAKRREQFGRPIGGFQAVKHLLADGYVRQELARAAVYAAGATLDDPGVGDMDRAAATAKAVAGEAALANARMAVQVHGGMGFTWEVPLHYLLKRAWVLEKSFGTAAGHAEALAAGLSAAPAGL